MLARDEYQQYIFEQVRRAIEQIPVERVADIYAFSFWLSAIDDDPRHQVVDFNYNTLTQVSRSERKASDAWEAKWNHASWLQNEIAVIGHEYDEKGALLYTAWLNEAGLNFSPQDEDEDLDRCIRVVDQIEDEFWRLCAEVGLKLHQGGSIASKFGRPIPIIIHNLEYDDKVTEVTRAANPEGVADEFLNWVENM